MSGNFYLRMLHHVSQKNVLKTFLGEPWEYHGHYIKSEDFTSGLIIFILYFICITPIVKLLLIFSFYKVLFFFKVFDTDTCNKASLSYHCCSLREIEVLSLLRLKGVTSGGLLRVGKVVVYTTQS